MAKTMPLTETPTPGRACWSCRHLYFVNADHGYSDYTPGTRFHLECGKFYWEFDAYKDDREAFRIKLQSAEACASFAPHKRKGL